MILVSSLAFLAGCEKPTPLVGVFSGRKYVNTPAAIWCFGGDSYAGPGSCSQRKVAAPSLKVRSGDQVSVDVPSEVRDRGWYVALAVSPTDQKPAADPNFQRGPIQKDTYFSFTVPPFPQAGVIPAQVIAIGKTTAATNATDATKDNSANSGIWSFVLVNNDVDGQH